MSFFFLDGGETKAQLFFLFSLDLGSFLFRGEKNQVKFGWIVQDDNVPDGFQSLQYTLSFQGPNVNPPGCAFI